MSCIRDNKVCTKCCEVIHIPVKKVNYLNSYRNHPKDSDTGFVVAYFKPMKRRIAKKRNPYMFKKDSKLKGVTFWKCKALTEKGCSIYDSRTQLCKGYPFYGKEPRYVQNQQKFADYSPSCTEFYTIPIKNID